MKKLLPFFVLLPFLFASCKQAVPVVDVTVPTPEVTVVVPSDDDSVETGHYPVIRYYSYDGSRLIKTVDAELGDSVTLETSTAPCFKGWSLDKNCLLVDYNASDSVTVEDNLTLYECRYYTVDYFITKSSSKPKFSEKYIYNQRCDGKEYSYENNERAFCFWTENTDSPTDIFASGGIVFNEDTKLYSAYKTVTITTSYRIVTTGSSYYYVQPNTKFIVTQIYSTGVQSGYADIVNNGATCGLYVSAEVGDTLYPGDFIYYVRTNSYSGKSWTLTVFGNLFTYSGEPFVKD